MCVALEIVIAGHNLSFIRNARDDFGDEFQEIHYLLKGMLLAGFLHLFSSLRPHVAMDTKFSVMPGENLLCQLRIDEFFYEQK